MALHLRKTSMGCFDHEYARCNTMVNHEIEIQMKSGGGGGAAQRRGSIIASHPAAQVQFPAFLKIFRGKIIDIADDNQRRWLEEIGRLLENVYQTHLVLASDKLLLQKGEKEYKGKNDQKDYKLLERATLHFKE